MAELCKDTLDPAVHNLVGGCTDQLEWDVTDPQRDILRLICIDSGRASERASVRTRQAQPASSLRVALRAGAGGAGGVGRQLTVLTSDST